MNLVQSRERFIKLIGNFVLEYKSAWFKLSTYRKLYSCVFYSGSPLVTNTRLPDLLCI